jgi:hypothetical protein
LWLKLGQGDTYFFRPKVTLFILNGKKKAAFGLSAFISKTLIKSAFQSQRAAGWDFGQTFPLVMTEKEPTCRVVCLVAPY